MASRGHSIYRDPSVERGQPYSGFFICSVRYCSETAYWVVAWEQRRAAHLEPGYNDTGRNYCDRHAMRFCMAHDVEPPKELQEVSE